MRRNSLRRSDRGDTIVEVLIAIAIVSSVLAGAFTVTQKSSAAVRDGQERGEMLQLLQGQVELVRASALTGASSDVFSTSPKYFCMDPASSTPTKQNYPLTVTSAPYPTANPAPYPIECKNIQGVYNIAVTYDDVSMVFTFNGYWERKSGGQNSMQLSYRIEP